MSLKEIYRYTLETHPYALKFRENGSSGTEDTSVKIVLFLLSYPLDVFRIAAVWLLYGRTKRLSVVATDGYDDASWMSLNKQKETEARGNSWKWKQCGMSDA